MIGRRRFLKLLGVGTAAAPLAAKVAAEEEVKGLTLMRGYQAPPLAQAFNEAAPSMYGGNELYAKSVDYMRVFGLPKHFEKQLRERAKHVHCLDPDIACKKSWSLNVKIQEQRQRNFKAQLKSYEDAGWYEKAQQNFEKVTGFRWIW